MAMNKPIFGFDEVDFNNPNESNVYGLNGDAAVLMVDTNTMGGGGGGNSIKTTLVHGCTDPTATNYNAKASINNGSCVYAKPIEEPIIRVVPGCTDKTALNFNPTATVNNGTCRYPIIQQPNVYNDSNSPIRVSVTSNNGTAAVFVNDVDIKRTTTHVLEFTEKELLTPKIISVKKSGFISKDEYKISSFKKTYETNVKRLPIISLSDRQQPLVSGDLKIAGSVESIVGPTTLLGKTITNYFEIVVEKKIDGKWVQQNVQKPGDLTNVTFLKNRIVSINAPFDLKQENVVVDVSDVVTNTGGRPIIVPTPNTEKSNKYQVRIIADVPNDETIQYRTNYGNIGYVLNQDDIVIFDIEQFEGQTAPYIEFFAQGISEYTHTASYVYQNGNAKQTKKSIDSKFELIPGTNDFNVNVQKTQVIVDSPNTPSVKVNQTNLVYNIAREDDVIKISYSSTNAESVVLTIGSKKTTIPSSGTVKLSKADFTNGIGRYTAYFQPISARGGSGEIQKVLITVESKAWLPGPDITTINYPQNIKGADFKGFDVDFQIDWQSINTNYVNIYAGKYSDSNGLGRYPAIGTASFNVQQLLKKLADKTIENKDVIQFKLLLVPFNIEGDELTEGKIEEIDITFDKGDLILPRAEVISDIKTSFTKEFNETGFDDYTSPFLTHYLHLGGGLNKLIGTWGIDRDTLSEKRINPSTNREEIIKEEKSLVLKLYEPLPRNITTNDTVWISKIQSIPLIDQVTILDDIVQSCTPLTPNFDLEIGDDIGYQILDDLIASGSVSSTEVVNQFISSSNFSLDNLNIQFVTQSYIESDSILIPGGDITWNFKEFVKYSSANERVQNFYYKVRLIEHYNTKYELVTSGSGVTEWTGSISVLNEANSYLNKINDVKKGFDAFEKWLYTSSSVSGLTYPGAGQNELSASTDSSTLNWFNSISYYASEYDEYNTSRLTYNLPKSIVNDSNNSDFILFFDMVGQHFDILWTHIKGVSQSKKLEHSFNNGISDNLIYHMLESLGWDADMGVKSQFLWEYAFGKHSDGTQISSMSGKDRQHEIWRRILNNLPYLYKHKGTKRALHAAMACYGIPASLLTVMEFGGPQDPTTSAITKFTYDDRTAAINISGSASVKVPWKEYSGTSDYPNSIEIRLNTDQRQDQQIISGSDWSLHLMKDSGSLAHLELRISGSGTLYSASSDSGSFFNDEYTQIILNKTTSGADDIFTFYAKEGFQERLRNNVSGSLIVPNGSDWEVGDYIQIGGATLTASVDEFRLWTTALLESRIDNHTLLPDAIDGNHVSSSTEDLIFRLDFEYPKNRHSSGDTFIKNVSINRAYGESYATASNFENVNSYPYQYTPYERTVTANVPSSGFNLGNKVRFETQTKISDLSYRQRATKKSFDQAPIDTDRLGLFFSPVKEINMDILKSLGSFNIDDYIGNPSDEYSNEYKDLRTLRNYYFDRYTLNFQEYIQLVRYIDKSLFTTLESLVPARAKVSSGLLIEPHILERSKTEWKPTSAEKRDYTAVINVEDDVNVFSTNEGLFTIITASNDTVLSGENLQFEGVIDAEHDVNLVGSTNDYSGYINTETDINLTGGITRNASSTMGGISITINAEFTGSLQGEYDSTAYTQIGMEPDSISNLGFGLYGENGNSIRTKKDKDNNYTKERVKVFLLKESYTIDVPENISADASQGREFVTQTKYKYKVNILPFTGSNGLETPTPSGGNIVEATPLNGYFPLHYRNVGDLTTGLENSFFNGSKQTSATTLDGGSPVQTFTTNPNTLRVSDTGRGSGEPILEVN